MRRIAIVVAALSVFVLILTVVIVKVTSPRDRVTTAMAASQSQTLQLPGITPAPSVQPNPTADVPQATNPPQATDAPSVEPTMAPTAEPAAPFKYLPVVKNAKITDKKIAITVDDCFQMNNLKRIAANAYNNGGKLTLFPIGKNVVKSGMAEILQTCVFKMGFEIENHTYNHARIFRLPEETMAKEIWAQSYAVNQALGVNYQQHFFRLMGGDGAYDQRTHNYLEQLGFLGVASWSVSGSDYSLEEIKNHLQPGAIYLFHTTDKDTAKLDKFIPYAVSQGYQLVTLNELFGLPENAVSDLSTASTEMPAPRPYTVEYREQKKGDYSWTVLQVQQKLYEMGYLAADAKSAVNGTPADGVYGDSTAKAVMAYQTASGLPATGVCDVETLKKLLG